ncbi:hypothetical protein ACHAWF_017819 [Thalassiosira exigua]
MTKPAAATAPASLTSILVDVMGTNSNGRLNYLMMIAVLALGFFLGVQYNEGNSNQSDVVPSHLNGITKAMRSTEREIHVGTMCRCGSKAFPVPGRMSETGHDTAVVQPPSKATGMGHSKRFIMHPPEAGTECTCIEDHSGAEETTDKNLATLTRWCPNPASSDYDWNALPDFAVEEKLPLFAGVLSYESPLSLNNSLHNWGQTRLFERTNVQDVFLQLNHRSELDDKVVNDYNEKLEGSGLPPLNVMGSPEENLHPGLAISKFCRAAEKHPNSHPNGENLLMFIEKDWIVHDGGPNGISASPRLEEVFHSLNALAQRGVHYIRLSVPIRETTAPWRCPSEGVVWYCATAHRQRWANTPFVLSCQWFLRYLEPFALFNDPIMYGCRPGE